MKDWYNTADKKIASVRSDIDKYCLKFDQDKTELNNLLNVLNRLIVLRQSELKRATELLIEQNQTIEFLNGNYTVELGILAGKINSVISIPECD
jgi:hypothetical protein